MSADQLDTVQQLADTALLAVEHGRNVLVRCHSGYNRSGLVVAQTLIGLGYDAPAAIDLVRSRRSPWALNNRVFTQYLEAGLGVAQLLVGLDAP
ncbi:protein-tyrosine phosphatase family protein [Actinosynnema sp. ALI-1.44]|uniref:protein-tyrosine phosphatase family protein n=1 Tax=Actinosynnema sp. ALI-1.44 TaxID=1933779 RepID=UPI00192CE941|nr:dual specificity protein phosphatase family protein [Actinosynnema sp. ALI-1.44]